MATINRKNQEVDKLSFEEQKLRSEERWKQIEAMRKDNEIRSTSIDKETGEPVIDYDKYAKLNELLAEDQGGMLKFANQTGQPAQGGMERSASPASQASPNMLSYINSLPEEQKQALSEKYNRTKTNEWGDDLTKNAPTATTTYKDGQRTWAYPGVKDPNTGEVRNSMSITAPYGSEEKYNNRGGVVGQRKDGSWIWDKNVKNGKNGSGGGFLMRGGLSDLGHALAGDAPRVVPPRPAAQPGGMQGLQFAGNQDVPRLDQGKYYNHLERMAYNGAFKNPGAMEAAAGNTAFPAEPEKSPGVVSKTENGRQVFYRNNGEGMIRMTEEESAAHVKNQPVLSPRYERPKDKQHLRPKRGMFAVAENKPPSLWANANSAQPSVSPVNYMAEMGTPTKKTNSFNTSDWLKRVRNKYPGTLTGMRN